MTNRKRETREIERKNVPFMFELDDECKIIKKTISD